MKALLTVVAALALISGMPALAQDTAPTETAAEPAAESETEQVTLIHAGWLLSVPGEAALRNRTIVVRGERIEQVLDGFDHGSSYEDAEIVDLTDSFVLPGLMDMHVHLSSVTGDDESVHINGNPDEAQGGSEGQRDDVIGFINAMANAQKTLDAGFTTVRNLGSSGWHIAALREAIAEGRVAGPRILTSAATIYPGSDNGAGACSGIESCRRAVRRQIDRGADLIKIYATCSGGKPCGRKDAPSTFIADELDAIVQTARTRQMKVAAHAHGEEGIRAALRAGVDSIEHGSYTPKDSIALYKRNGTYLVPTLSVQDNIRKDLKEAEGPMREVMETFLAHHGPGMMAAYRAGVKIAAGSDAGVTVHGANARELEVYVLQGMPPSDAIIAATINGADLIGRSDDLGSVEAGKIADIIAVSGNPLEDIASLKQVHFVMKDGAVHRNDTAATP